MPADTKPLTLEAERLVRHGWKFNGTWWAHPLLPGSGLGPASATFADPFVQAGLERLRTAVRLIRLWQGMRLNSNIEPVSWSFYYRRSPEMQPIREALGPEGEGVKHAYPI
jgi:hypothetical protein